MYNIRVCVAGLLGEPPRGARARAGEGRVARLLPQAPLSHAGRRRAAERGE